MGNRCERCGSATNLECHHRDPRGSDADENLILLCAEDHRAEEENRTVHINVRKVDLADALMMVREKYASYREL